MLEKWIETLEKRKVKLLEKVKRLTRDERTAELARREIEVNAASVKNYLSQLSERGFSVEDDLRRNLELYHGNEDYRMIANHLSNHLFRMKDVVTQLRRGRFKPYFSRNY